MTDRIRKNTLLSILISLFRYAYPAVSFVYVARILHPSGLGRVNYASALTSCFAMITGLGMSLYGLRAVAARRQSGLASLASELFLLRGLFGMFAWALFLVFLVIGRETDRALLFIYGFSIPGAIPECEWLYKGNEDYVTLSLISVGSRVLGLAALLLFVRSASDVYAYAWIAVAMGLGAHTAEMIVAQRRWGLNVFRNSAAVLAAGRLGAVLREHLPSLLLFFMMSCAVTVYSQTDTIMLKLFKGDEAVGLYACAAKVKHMMPVITGALFAAAMPSSVELWRHNRKEVFLDLSHRSFHVVLTILTPLALYFFVFAEPCVRLLGGAEYRSAALPMRVLMLAVVSIGLSNIAGGQILISMGQERRLFRAEVIGALCNILMNILLIPAFSVTGAAIATALSETLVAVMTIHSAKGLEFDNVFLIGLDEGIFPGTQSIFGGESEIEEERRLMYVAITRAKKELTISNAVTRMVFGSTNRNMPSRFLKEIPNKYCDCAVKIGNATQISSFGFENSFYTRQMPIKNKTYNRLGANILIPPNGF